MRILFLGTSVFAGPSLERLYQSPQHEVVGVVTQPDRPHGRGGRAAYSPVKAAALGMGLLLFQPEKVRTKEFAQTVRALEPDALAVAAFGQIIPQRILDIPHRGGINVHGSLLPRWRGAAPMQYALMAGDTETGVTTMQMDAGLDTGDILLQESLPLTDDDSLGTIEPQLAEIGGRLLLLTLERLEAGNLPRTPQDPALVTPAPSLPPNIGALDWTRPARDLHNLVRGVTPRPGAYGMWQGRRLKIWKTSVVSDTPAARMPEPGRVENISPAGIIVETGKGALRLEEVQPESKARMSADAWARGARIGNDQRFGLAPK